jgi:hypothetical protein
MSKRSITEILADNTLKFSGCEDKYVLDALREARAAIKEAPHQMGCASLQGGPDTEGWATLDKCDCWKAPLLKKWDEPS